ncbi:hypothetical protein QTP86_030991, partial [Hemibagrus guttatus]
VYVLRSVLRGVCVEVCVLRCMSWRVLRGVCVEVCVSRKVYSGKVFCKETMEGVSSVSSVQQREKHEPGDGAILSSCCSVCEEQE